MAAEEKPYRRYRGGRVKGKVPLPSTKPAKTPKAAKGTKAPRKRRSRVRMALLAFGAFVLLFLVWGALGFLSFSRGVGEANDRLPDRVERRLAGRDGSLLTTPATTLVIGTDGGRAPGRRDARRSDSLMLIRTDPGTQRLAYLSIPRDLRVDIPGYGSSKINSANQIGGPALTLATVRALTGLSIHHAIVVDFDGFRDLIDAVGGIDITVPKPILSNKFDCPYPRRRCATWEGWRFGKGEQHMDGRRALVYSRIRTNQLDPSESDLTRTARQQAVTDALGDKIASFGTYLKLPFIGDSLASPLATDLSASELAQLGWVRFRANSSLRCRLGGELGSIGGESVIIGGEDNVAVIGMFVGRTAPLAPRKGVPLAAGCTRSR